MFQIIFFSFRNRPQKKQPMILGKQVFQGADQPNQMSALDNLRPILMLGN